MASGASALSPSSTLLELLGLPWIGEAEVRAARTSVMVMKTVFIVDQRAKTRDEGKSVEGLIRREALGTSGLFL